jgi:hypothetical protein
MVGCVVIVGLLVVVGIAGGAYIFWRTSYTAPVRRAPDIPQRTAGTLTEFPVDTDPAGPRPGAVASEVLASDTAGSSSSSNSSQAVLPPGVDRSKLSRGATAMTSATYRAHPQRTVPTSASGARAGKDEVYICVLTAMPGAPNLGEDLSTSVVSATGGQQTGVRVQSPKGAVYTGTVIRSAQTTVYVLQKQGGDIVILIYAPDPDTKDVADQLAQKVGNGEGLNDYPEIKQSLWTLPVSTPGDLTLQETKTLTRAQIENSLANPSSSGNDDSQKLLGQMRQFIPERMTGARYKDRQGQDWVAIEMEYESPFQSWKTWLLARGVLGLSGAQSTTVCGVDGVSLNQDGKRLLVFQKGPYLVLLGAPGGASVDSLVQLGNQFQL